MSGRHRLADFMVAFDPTVGEIGRAEFDARLAALLGTSGASLDDTLRALPAVRLTHLIHADEEPARQFRRRLRLVDRGLCAEAVEEAWARAAADGALPSAALHSALVACACLEPITDEERLVAEIHDAREEIVALWPQAFDAVARWGSIDETTAWSIGIGPVVYGMMAESLGRTAPERITREAFVPLCPRLVACWPLTPASLESMRTLLAMVRAAAAGEIVSPASRIDAVS